MALDHMTQSTNDWVFKYISLYEYLFAPPYVAIENF